MGGRVARPNELMVGLGGLEPPTSRLSGVRSNHLSYKPNRADTYKDIFLPGQGIFVRQRIFFQNSRPHPTFTQQL